MKPVTERKPLTNNIGWCDATANAVIGCTKWSPGCLNCYAENTTPVRVLRAKGIETWGPKGIRHPVAALAEKARRLNKSCICDQCRQTRAFHYLADPGQCGCGGTLRRIRLFANSNSDFLDKEWRPSVRAALFETVFRNQNVDFLLSTKRPENWHAMAIEAAEFADPDTADWLEAWTDCVDMPDRGAVPQNVWAITSVENQKCTERIDHLLRIPAVVRGLSMEPLLEYVTLYPWIMRELGLRAISAPQGIHWVIVGGESDQPKSPARPCNVDWVRRIVRQCQAAKVPVYVKQLGDHCLDRNDAGFEGDKDDGWPMDTATEETAVSGCQGDPVRILFKTKAGADPAERPADLRVRQFPNFKP